MSDCVTSMPNRTGLSQILTFKHIQIGVSIDFKFDLVPFTLQESKFVPVDSFLWFNGSDSWSTVC